MRNCLLGATLAASAVLAPGPLLNHGNAVPPSIQYSPNLPPVLAKPSPYLPGASCAQVVGIYGHARKYACMRALCVHLHVHMPCAHVSAFATLVGACVHAPACSMRVCVRMLPAQRAYFDCCVAGRYKLRPLCIESQVHHCTSVLQRMLQRDLATVYVPYVHHPLHYKVQRKRRGAAIHRQPRRHHPSRCVSQCSGRTFSWGYAQE